jgi:hypothetical protein
MSADGESPALHAGRRKSARLDIPKTNLFENSERRERAFGKVFDRFAKGALKILIDSDVFTRRLRRFASPS